MAGFRAAVDVRAGAAEVWQRLTDWPAHERWVPLTKITVLSDHPGGVGGRFLARSGVGRLGFDDPMEITEWRPPTGGSPGQPGEPGRCALVKLGRLVTGTALLEVRALPSGLTRATWSEQVEIAPVRLTRRLEPVLGPVIAAAGGFGFGRALRAMAREVEGEKR